MAINQKNKELKDQTLSRCMQVNKFMEFMEENYIDFQDLKEL